MTIHRADMEALKLVHHICEDCWYSCPLSKEGCCDDRETECNCGATAHNAKVDALIQLLEAQGVLQ